MTHRSLLLSAALLLSGPAAPPLDVVVVDRDGVPMKASVHVFSRGGAVEVRESSTDDAGRARFAGLPAEAVLCAGARAEGYVSAVQEGIRTDAGTVRLVLERGAILEGTVQAPGARPLAMALVHVRSGDAVASVFTDPAGRFRIPDAPAGLLQITVQEPGRERRFPERRIERRVGAGDHVTGLVLAVDAPAGVRGRVVRPDGSPVEGATVTFELSPHEGAGEDPAPGATVSTGRDGSFELPVQPGRDDDMRFHVVARAAGLAPDSAGLDDPVLTLGEPASLVVRPGRRPPARVRLLDGRGLPRSIPLDGGEPVRVEDLAPGEATLFVHPDREIPVELAAGRTAEVVVDTGPSLSGTVRRDGEPVEGAVVGAVDAGNRLVGHAWTDGEGRYTLADLPSGPVRLIAAAGSARAALRTVAGEDAPDLAGDLDLVHAVFEVRVLDAASGRPVSEVAIVADGEGGEAPFLDLRRYPGRGRTSFDLTCGAGNTGREGRARVELAWTGRTRVVAKALGYERWEGAVVAVRGETPLEIRMVPETPPAP